VYSGLTTALTGVNIDLDVHPMADGGRVGGVQPPNVIVVVLDGDVTGALAAARSYRPA
jgi:hypothetical protein